jgi:endoglucanase
MNTRTRCMLPALGFLLAPTLFGCNAGSEGTDSPSSGGVGAPVGAGTAAGANGGRGGDDSSRVPSPTGGMGGAQGGGGGNTAGGGASSGGAAASGGGGSPSDGGSILPGDAGSRPAPGYLSTRGRNLIDSQGNVVRITALNWFGLETSTYAPHGLWARSMSALLDQVVDLGYNALRVPFSTEMFDAGSTPNGIDFSLNPDLAGLDALGIVDKLVDGARTRGLKIVLDRHRPGAEAQSALWYTAEYGEQRWIDDWKMLAARYSGDDTVIGFDLHNEPRGEATWGSGAPATDFRAAAERAGNAIHEVNPELLIIVEGVEAYDGADYWWGGNLRGAKAHPVRLNVPNKLVYSPHDYPASVHEQPWFDAANYPDNLTALWDETWGYLVKENIAPIWLGEFGTKLETEKDEQWLAKLAEYIDVNNLSFAFWCLNPNSGDTGGILLDDWTTVHQGKQAVLEELLAPKLR